MRICRWLRSPRYEVPRLGSVLAAGLILSADAVIPGLGGSIWLLGALDELAHMATNYDDDQFTSSFFGGSVDDCTCMTFCLPSCSKYFQPSACDKACVPVMIVPL